MTRSSAVLVLVLVLAAAPAARAAETYISLGDSYSSGEGAGSYSPASGECHRSPLAWPRLVGVKDGDHLACSGATTVHVLKSGKGPDKDPQVTALGRRTAISPGATVLMTIGGNDLHFSAKVKSCRFNPAGCLKNRAKLRRELGDVRAKVLAAYRSVKAAPNVARVVAVGYPDIFPGNHELPQRCGWLTESKQSNIAWLAASFNATLRGAAADAGIQFLPVRNVLDNHELCTRDSWMVPLTSKLGDWAGSPEQGHPDSVGQIKLAQAIVTALSPGGGAACTPSNSLANIIDDSGSMDDNDPQNIRGRAMQLLITKPSSGPRRFSAVEFGSTAGTLFGPSIVSSNQQAMLSSLYKLRNDGADDDGDETNYNAAFDLSGSIDQTAGARLFLTDGGHNVDDYEDGHRNGPPTYVIGLNIGPAGTGEEKADLLQRIASESGGRYFPLLQSSSDSESDQLDRLQPVVNQIDALLTCSRATVESTVGIDAANKPSAPVAALFAPQPALEVVISWTSPGVDVDLASAVAHGQGGQVIADLNGRPAGNGKPARDKLDTSTVEGSTFETVTIAKPAGGTDVLLKVKAPALPGPTAVTVQVRPTSTLPSGGASPAPTSGPVTTPAPTQAPTASPTRTPAPTATPAPTPAQPVRKVITVDNRVTNGGGMREDSTPVRLTTQPWAYCGRRGCNINGTERSSGGTYDAAVCQRQGERITNGNDSDPSDDANPSRFESTRYYGVRLPDNTFGFVSEVWIRAADRGGLGLPSC